MINCALVGHEQTIDGLDGLNIYKQHNNEKTRTTYTCMVACKSTEGRVWLRQ
jgi:hypothetical protein